MSEANIPIAVLRLGRIFATPNALQHLEEQDIRLAIQRHQAGDWGELSEDDAGANHAALVHGRRVFSVYHAVNGTKFWVITEADRSVTTILLPEDY